MKCPLDKSDMIVVEHEKIEIDHCLTCAGVWFDAGELGLLVTMLKKGGTSISQTDLLTPHEVKSNEAKRKCPVCGRKMNKANLGNVKTVLVDSCPRGDGIWFDSGELQQVLNEMEQLKTLSSRDILSFLGGAFQATHGASAKK